MKIGTYLVVLIMFCGVSAFAGEFYISTGGNDTGPGTKDQPFATLERTRDAIRQLSKEHLLPDDGVVVWLRGGVYERSKTFYKVQHQINPHESRYRSEFARYTLGWYIPNGWIFPMGDNRDNSNDGRYFGPVRLSKVLGKAMFIYWPISRMGAAR